MAISSCHGVNRVRSFARVRPHVSAPHILHVFSTFVPAGPEMRTVNLIHGLAREFRHSIVAMDGRTDARERLAADAPVEILESPPKAGSIATVRRMRALIRRVKPDLLCSYNWGAFDAVMAARTLGLRSVIHHEDGFTADEVSAAFKFQRTGIRVPQRRQTLQFHAGAEIAGLTREFR